MRPIEIVLLVLATVQVSGLAVIAALFWAQLKQVQEDRALLRHTLDRTLPTPPSAARSVSPPEQPEERAARIGRGELNAAEVDAAARRLRQKYGDPSASPEQIEAEIERLTRLAGGEL